MTRKESRDVELWKIEGSDFGSEVFVAFQESDFAEEAFVFEGGEGGGVAVVVRSSEEYAGRLWVLGEDAEAFFDFRICSFFSRTGVDNAKQRRCLVEAYTEGVESVGSADTLADKYVHEARDVAVDGYPDLGASDG